MSTITGHENIWGGGQKGRKGEKESRKRGGSRQLCQPRDATFQESTVIRVWTLGNRICLLRTRCKKCARKSTVKKIECEDVEHKEGGKTCNSAAPMSLFTLVAAVHECEEHHRFNGRGHERRGDASRSSKGGKRKKILQKKVIF